MCGRYYSLRLLPLEATNLRRTGEGGQCGSTLPEKRSSKGAAGKGAAQHGTFQTDWYGHRDSATNTLQTGLASVAPGSLDVPPGINVSQFKCGCANVIVMTY